MNIYTCGLCAAFDVECSCEPYDFSLIPEDAKRHNIRPWNVGRAGTYSIHDAEGREKISKRQKGRVWSEEQKRNQAAAARNHCLEQNQLPRNPESIKKGLDTRQKRIEMGLINPYSPERNAKMANSKKGTKRVYNPDGTFRMVKMNQFDQ